MAAGGKEKLMKAFFKLLSPPAALFLGMLTFRYRMRRRVLKNAHLLSQDAARVEVFLAITLPGPANPPATS